MIITDTVGFIRDLPKDLIAAFKATLEELEDASLLLHTVDASDPSCADQVRWVEQILMDLNLAEIPRLIVLNKTDLIPDEQARSLEGVCIVAKERASLYPLLERIEHHLWPRTDRA